MLRFRGPVAGLALMTLVSLTGCSSLGSGDDPEPAKSGSSKERPSGMHAQEAYQRLMKTVDDTFAAVVPDVEVEREPAGKTACGGPDVIDSKDESKIRMSAGYSAVVQPAKGMTPKALRDKAVQHLRGKGWQEDRKIDSRIVLVKDGSHGEIAVDAETFRLTSGKNVYILHVNPGTDCLANREWKN